MLARSTCTGSAILLLVFGVLATSARAELVDGLRNYWNFDNNLTDHAHTAVGSASTVADDGVFEGLNGTDGIGYGAGLFGSGIDLNGAGGGAAGQENDGTVRITRSADTLYGSTSTLSISAWVQASGFDTNWQTVISHGEGNQYRVARRSGDVPEILAYAGGSGDIPNAAGIGPSIAPGTGWHHLVAISEGGVSTRLWVDGSLVATGGAPAINDAGNSGAPGGATPNLIIGGNPQTGNNNREWWGQIDDVAIWDRVLTDQEIGEIYQGGTPTQSIGDIVAPVIPEPSSIVLAVLGVVGAGIIGWRRRRRKA